MDTCTNKVGDSAQVLRDMREDTCTDEWFDIIRQNNATEAKSILESASVRKRNILLNGNFNFGDLDQPQAEWTFTTTKPLFLAAIFGSLDILKLFYFYCADFCQTDEEGNNLIHSLVSVSFCNPRYETRCIEMYKKITDLLDEGPKNRLLRSENKEGLLPLELAAHFSCLRFFKVLMETPGVHTIQVEQKGIQQQAWLDITDYESFDEGNRRDRSPLFLFSLVEKKIFQDDEASEVFRSPVMKKWMRAKLIMNCPLLLLWILFRITHTIAFYVVATAGGEETPRLLLFTHRDTVTLAANSSNPDEPAGSHVKTNCSTYIYFPKESGFYWTAVTAVYACGSIVLLFDVTEYIIKRCKNLDRLRKTPKGTKKYFVNETFYRFVGFVLKTIFSQVTHDSFACRRQTSSARALATQPKALHLRHPTTVHGQQTYRSMLGFDQSDL